MSDEQAEIVGEAADGSEEATTEEPSENGEERSEEIGENAEFEAGSTADEDDETDLVERVTDASAEDVAREITSLRDRVDELEIELEATTDERDELEDRLKRKQAEFQNYKKRQKKRREQEAARATEDLVSRLLEVRDNLKRALDVDEGADIRDGVEATFRQLDDVLSAENVEPIEPEPGADVDPKRHEVLLRVESDQPPGTVDEVHRPGYEMAEKVLRPAQVTVSETAE